MVIERVVSEKERADESVLNVEGQLVRVSEEMGEKVREWEEVRERLGQY